jgi:hypothetical protein
MLSPDLRGPGLVTWGLPGAKQLVAPEVFCKVAFALKLSTTTLIGPGIVLALVFVTVAV